MSTNRQPPPQPSPGVPEEGETSGDPRLVAAVQEYMSAVEAGRRPSRREWLARYPDVAAELSACLDGLAFVQSAAGQMHDAAPVSGDHHAGDIDVATAQP